MRFARQAGVKAAARSAYPGSAHGFRAHTLATQHLPESGAADMRIVIDLRFDFTQCAAAARRARPGFGESPRCRGGSARSWRQSPPCLDLCIHDPGSFYCRSGCRSRQGRAAGAEPRQDGRRFRITHCRKRISRLGQICVQENTWRCGPLERRCPVASPAPLHTNGFRLPGAASTFFFRYWLAGSLTRLGTSLKR